MRTCFTKRKEIALEIQKCRGVGHKSFRKKQDEDMNIVPKCINSMPSILENNSTKYVKTANKHKVSLSVVQMTSYT